MYAWPLLVCVAPPPCAVRLVVPGRVLASVAALCAWVNKLITCVCVCVPPKGSGMDDESSARCVIRFLLHLGRILVPVTRFHARLIASTAPLCVSVAWLLFPCMGKVFLGSCLWLWLLGWFGVLSAPASRHLCVPAITASQEQTTSIQVLCAQPSGLTVCGCQADCRLLSGC